MSLCIWCKKENSDVAIEHIFPEALGCPEYFILGGGLVCQDCNNGLSHLDQAVIADFDVPLFLANIRRKKGRAPVIQTRGNFSGTRGSNGPELFINMEKYAVTTHQGERLGAFGKSDRNINASFALKGDQAEINFSTQIGQNPKFIRGIVKIGFSSLTYFLGGQTAQDSTFDPIRDFVRFGHGSRKILLMMSADKELRNQAWPPFQSPTKYFVTTFRLLVTEFCVDLSPDHSLFPILKKSAGISMGNEGWTWLPLER